MRTDKDKAIELRYKGHSYREISQILSVSKSTLSYWLRDLSLSLKAQEKIKATYSAGYKKGLLNRSVAQTEQAIIRAKTIRQNSSNEIGSIDAKTLKLIGLALYWGEGHKRVVKVRGRKKTSHPVSLTNSDPVLIKTFILFLIEVCNVERAKIRLGLRLFAHQNEKEILKYWVSITGLPLDNFIKVYYGVSISSKRMKPFNVLPFGTLQVNVYNTQLYYKIMGWLDGLQNSIGKFGS